MTTAHTQSLQAPPCTHSHQHLHPNTCRELGAEEGGSEDDNEGGDGLDSGDDEMEGDVGFADLFEALEEVRWFGWVCIGGYGWLRWVSIGWLC